MTDSLDELVPAALAGERLDRVVATLTDLPRSVVAELITDGAVLVGGKAVRTRSVKVLEHARIQVTIPDQTVPAPQPEAGIDLNVAYEDADIVVINKPAGLVVHPGAGHDTGTLVHALLDRYPDLAEARPGDPERPGIVHRLDVGTSGLMLVARTARAYEALVDMLQVRAISRHYLALVWGEVQPDNGVIDAPIGRATTARTRMAVATDGRPARTHYEVLARQTDPDVSLVAAKLETGRTHQIRVHFAAIEHPVVGDGRYRGVRQGITVERPFLHATRLSFTHPFNDEELTFDAALPDDLRTALSAVHLDPDIRPY